MFLNDMYEMEKEAHEIAKKLIKKYIGKNMLEVGCGDEKFMEEISKIYDINIICIDPYGHGKNIIRMRGEEIEKLNKKFDLIYTIMSFHHIEDAKKFLKGVKNSLKENGKIIIIDWKNGVYTGVPEYYYSLKEVIEMMKDYKIIEAKEEKYHFYIVAS